MDYIPHDQAVFFNWQDNHVNVLGAESVGWIIPLVDLNALQGLQKKEGTKGRSKDSKAALALHFLSAIKFYLPLLGSLMIINV